MVQVITNEEWAAETGRPLAAIEAMITEAEADAITRDTLDPATLNPPELPPEAEARARAFLEAANSH